MKQHNARPFGISATTGVKDPHARDGSFPQHAEYSGRFTKEMADEARKKLLADALRGDEAALATMRLVRLRMWWNWLYCHCRGGHNGSYPPKDCRGWVLINGVTRRGR